VELSLSDHPPVYPRPSSMPPRAIVHSTPYCVAGIEKLRGFQNDASAFASMRLNKKGELRPRKLPAKWKPDVA
jgi:hypothetical protein